MKKENLHRIIMAVPGVFVVAVLFLSRQLELALLLLVFDIIGTIGGIWWLSFSKKLAHRAHNAISSKHGHTFTPGRMLRILVVAVIGVFIFWGMVMMVKVAVGNVVSLRCVADIPQAAWTAFGECLKNSGNCTNPVLICKG